MNSITNSLEHQFWREKNKQNHDIESIYEPNINSTRYGEQEERVLARITAEIKEFILSVTDSQKRPYRRKSRN